ncbi:MAG TPA: type III polyketide synthase [Sedimentisphaerales bacterium]|nr:type III polyketide synthase [Sedimentisphaerales bacterium]
MSVYIQNIACMVPPTSYSQSFIKDKMKGWLKGSARLNRCIDSIYNHSCIQQRHSVIPDADAFFRVSGDGDFSVPTTKARNDMYTQAAKKMSVDLATEALAGCPNAYFNQITHLITVSCTGFFNPGPDYEIIKSLNLNKSIQRYSIGFMGCYAAFPALRLARAICRSDPDATVLIIVLELCTLHAQLTRDLDSIRSGAIFADGGAGVVVSTKKPGPNRKVLELEHFESMLIPDTHDDMAWTIGDSGFEMALSKYVPKIIEANIPAILNPILRRRAIDISRIDHWAVHPGGKAILDRIESSLGLEDCLRESRSVLKRYGNMSSPTVLFVLKQILQKPAARPRESVLSMAFGPGLTVEVAFLTKITTPAAAKEKREPAAPPSPFSPSGDSFSRVQMRPTRGIK